MSENSIIKKIDTKLFSQVDNLNSSSLYQAFQEKFSSLDDDIKEVVKYIFSILLIIIPILLTLLFWFNNLSLKEDLQLRKDLYNQANYVLQDQKSFGEVGKKLIPSGAAASKGALSTKLSSILKRSQIATNDIQVKNFNSVSLNDKIQKNTADIVFNNFTTAHLSKLSSEISFRLKAKIMGIQVLRKTDEQLLEGKVSITYLSPAS